MTLKDNEDVSQEEHRALMALSMVPGIGPGRIRQLIRTFWYCTWCHRGICWCLGSLKRYRKKCRQSHCDF